MISKSLRAEFIGTFMLIFIGAGTAALGHGALTVALAHGLVVVAFSYAYGRFSGCHINPAVTFAFLVLKKIPVSKALTYWGAQFLGGIAGAGVLAFLLSSFSTTLGATVLDSGISPIQGVLTEGLLTFVLVNTILYTALNDRGGSMTGLVIGLSLTVSILFGFALTGASLNPARTLGPAILTSNFQDLWVYFAGPLLGAGAAALTYLSVLKDQDA